MFLFVETFYFAFAVTESRVRFIFVKTVDCLSDQHMNLSAFRSPSASFLTSLRAMFPQCILVCFVY